MTTNSILSARRISIPWPRSSGIPRSRPRMAIPRTRVPAYWFRKRPRTLDWKDGGRFGFAPKLKKGTNFVLGDLANFERTNAFSYGCWMRMSAPGQYGPLIARMDETNAYRGWDLMQTGKKLAVHLVNKF